MRIGDVAKAVGTTVRTIRYYEELGLLATSEREAGAHRTYAESDVERLAELLRLKTLLGVTLDELRELAADTDARALLRAELLSGDVPEARQAELLDQALAIAERQERLIARRRAQLDALEAEVRDRRERIVARQATLGAPAPG